MYLNGKLRKSVIKSLIPRDTVKLLDVGCGPLTRDYAYGSSAQFITCIDARLSTFGVVPKHLTCIDSDFLEASISLGTFDAVIVSDVLEHITIENEAAFISKCVAAVKPGGAIIVSVPHEGAYSWLDPYKVKPALGWVALKLRLSNQAFNGTCDVRKGHKHYVANELIASFRGCEADDIRYWGLVYDPLLSWSDVVHAKLGKAMPWSEWLERKCLEEFEIQWGERAYNIAIRFRRKAL